MVCIVFIIVKRNNYDVILHLLKTDSNFPPNFELSEPIMSKETVHQLSISSDNKKLKC